MNCWARRERERGWALLVELLVGAVIIGILAWYLLRGPGSPMGGGTATTTPGVALEAGRKAACRTQLHEVRQAVEAYKLEQDGNPASIADLAPYGVTDQIARCPDGREAYQLDPATGQVRCPHPGHEQL
jgi:hypothetical protein